MTFVTEGVGGPGNATLKFKVPTIVLACPVLYQGGNGIGCSRKGREVADLL
jgi:hypothetical protein